MSTAMFPVVFRNRKRSDIDAAAYSADADAMEQLARSQRRFLSFRSYTAFACNELRVHHFERDTKS